MRKALLVGINKYATAGSDLQGCVNDVTNVRDILLKYYGFTVPDIRVLTDDRATKVNIIERLGWLIAEVSAGDNIVFHFSGHGSQIRDRNGDELKDGLDEIICPHDMDWDGTFITDDELAMGKQQLKGQITLSMESVSARMYRAAAVELFNEPYRPLDEVLARVDAVTSGEVAAVCRDFYGVEQQTVVRLGPI